MEYALLQNAIIDYFLLFLSASTVHIHPKKTRTLLASLIGAFFSLIFPYLNSPFVINLFKLALACAMIIVCLGQTTIKKVGFCLLSLCAYTYAFGGLIYALGGEQIANGYALPNHIIWLMCGGIVIFFIFAYVWTKLLAKRQKKKQFFFDTTFVRDGKKFTTLAYLDSGNNLIDRDNSPVVIITPKVMTNICDITLERLIKKDFDGLGLKDLHYITLDTIASGQKILVFKIDRLEIKQNGKKQVLNNVSCGLCFKNFSSYNALLNYQQVC